MVTLKRQRFTCNALIKGTTESGTKKIRALTCSQKQYQRFGTAKKSLSATTGDSCVNPASLIGRQLELSPAYCRGLRCSHLGLNAIKPSEPEDLPPPQLPLRVVDLLVVVIDVVLRQLVLLAQLSRPPEESQPAIGYGGYHRTSREGERERGGALMRKAG